jgi:uncharacterized protein YcbK (DUF882 family)
MTTLAELALGAPWSRRQFLWQAGTVCGSAAMLALRPGLAAVSLPAPLEPVRRVSFLHTHTGERLTADYYAGGRYQPQCLEQVDHLLRDYRTGEVHRMDPGLLDILFDLQGRAGSAGPFEVISAYRSPATNAMLRRKSSGVAEHSMHMLGKAIDVRLRGFSTRRLAELARQVQRGGVGFYAASDFVHVDTGRVRVW